MSSTRALRGLRETALWSGALLGLLAVGAGLAVTLFHCSFLVFRSGSMSPSIETGALALARQVDAVDLEPGDVVTVRTADGALVTHRVVDTTMRGEEASLVLQGDANAAPDAEVYTVRSVDRVVADVPYLGYVVAHALTPAGVVAMASVCLMLFLVPADDRGVRAPAGRGGRHRGRRVGRRATAVVVPATVTAVVVGAAAATGGVTGTWAAFNDAATMRSGAFGATDVAPAHQRRLRQLREPGLHHLDTADRLRAHRLPDRTPPPAGRPPSRTSTAGTTQWRPARDLPADDLHGHGGGEPGHVDERAERRLGHHPGRLPRAQLLLLTPDPPRRGRPNGHFLRRSRIRARFPAFHWGETGVVMGTRARMGTGGVPCAGRTADSASSCSCCSSSPP